MPLETSIREAMRARTDGARLVYAGEEANALDGTRVALSGPLELDDGAFSSMVACAPGTCCNEIEKNVVLGERPHALKLDGLTCRGDESRLCCNVLAHGQSVIVSGTLRRVGPIWWELEDASLCEVGD
jgi:hypothetical protein